MSDMTVIGAGSWGTALALHLARRGHRVRLWFHDPRLEARVRSSRINIPISSASPQGADLPSGAAKGPLVTQAV